MICWRQARIFAIVGALLFGTAAAASTPTYPDKPIRLIVPTVPGGATDFTARYLAQHLGTALGQSIIVDNRPGADGRIGLEAAAKAAPDGYTLVMPITSFSTNPSLYSNLPFDTINDFAPVAMVSKAPLLLVVTPKLPVKSVAELIAYAKTHPGKLNFANSGKGTMSNISAQLFKSMANIDIVPIGYKGAGQIMTDLVAGQIQIYFATIPAAQQLVSNGKLRALGVSTPERTSHLPSIPSISQSGLAGFEVVSWFGLFAPAGAPTSIIERLNQETNKILSQPDTRKEFEREGLLTGGGSPEELREFLLADIKKWNRVITNAGLNVD